MRRIWLALLVVLCASMAAAQEPVAFPDRPFEDEVSQRLRVLEAEIARLKQVRPAPSVPPGQSIQQTSAELSSDEPLDVPLQPQLGSETAGEFSDAAGSKPASEQQLKDLEKAFKDYKAEKARLKYPTVEVHGAIQADTAWFSQDPASLNTVGDIQDGAGFRRVRLSANGAAMENLNYFLQMDFAAFGRPTFTDVWMEVAEVPVLGNVRVGQWKQPFSLEVVSSYRYTTFAERSLLFQAFDPFRHIGVGFWDYRADERMTWAASVYRSGQDQFGDSLGDNGGYAGVGRITWLPYYECEGSSYWHLGAGYNAVFPANRVARFRTIPEYFVGEVVGGPVGTSGFAVNGQQNGTPTFVDTGAIPLNNYQLVGLESLIVEGPFSLQSEYQFLYGKRTNDVDQHFHGGYTQAGYFLTGEHRPYLTRQGAIDRIKVLRPLLLRDASGCYGWGGWEVATRISHIDLNSNSVQGGVLTDLTLGLNWYLNNYSKVQLNYVHAYLDNPIVGHSDTDIYGLRAQVDF